MLGELSVNNTLGGMRAVRPARERMSRRADKYAIVAAMVARQATQPGGKSRPGECGQGAPCHCRQQALAERFGQVEFDAPQHTHVVVPPSPRGVVIQVTACAPTGCRSSRLRQVSKKVKRGSEMVRLQGAN